MRRVMIALFVSAALLFGACGEGDDEDTASDDTAAEDGGGDDGGGGGGSTITIEGSEFTNATAAPGDAVKVENKDSFSHTVTSDDGKFDSGNVDGSGEITAPDEPGEYPFHCNIHPSMKGTLTVES